MTNTQLNAYMSMNYADIMQLSYDTRDSLEHAQVMSAEYSDKYYAYLDTCPEEPTETHFMEVSDQWFTKAQELEAELAQVREAIKLHRLLPK